MTKRMRKTCICALTLSLIASTPVYADMTETDKNKEGSTTETAPVASENEQESEEAIKNISDTSGITMTLGDFKTSIAENQELFSVNNDDMFNMMKASLDAGESISLGEAFSMSSGLEIPSNFMYDLSDSGLTGEVDFQSVNLEYASLLAGMNNKLETAAQNLSSNTMDATAYFKQNYGNLGEQLQVGEATLPKGFSFTELTKGNSDSMMKAYESALKSTDYQKVRSKINVTDIFDEAKKGPAARTLMTDSELRMQLGQYGNGMRASARFQRDKNFESITNDYEALLNEREENEYDGIYDPDGKFMKNRNKTAEQSDINKAKSTGDKNAWEREKKRKSINEELENTTDPERKKELKKELEDLNSEENIQDSHPNPSFQNKMAEFNAREQRAKQHWDITKLVPGVDSQNDVIKERNDWLKDYFDGDVPEGMLRDYVDNETIFGVNVDTIQSGARIVWNHITGDDEEAIEITVDSALRQGARY